MAQPCAFFWRTLLEFESSPCHWQVKWLQLEIVICKKFFEVLEIELLNTSYLLYNCRKQIKWVPFARLLSKFNQSEYRVDGFKQSKGRLSGSHKIKPLKTEKLNHPTASQDVIRICKICSNSDGKYLLFLL